MKRGVSPYTGIPQLLILECFDTHVKQNQKLKLKLILASLNSIIDMIDFCLFFLAGIFSLINTGVVGDDPAQGWLGYALAQDPTGENRRITFIEAYWAVCDDPKVSGAFFSPWFGIETSDNKNLIQPVNPWDVDEWLIYNEYYQWDPTHNENSRSHTVSAGDILYGSVSFNEDDESYTVYHSDLNDNWSVTSTIDVQEDSKNGGYKNYTMSYFVFEKEARCNQYPPDGKVTFYNISIFWDGVKQSPKWTTAYVDDVCNSRANVIDESTIEITWDTD